MINDNRQPTEALARTLAAFEQLNRIMSAATLETCAASNIDLATFALNGFYSPSTR